MKASLKALQKEYDTYYWDCYRNKVDVNNIFQNFCQLVADKYDNIVTKPTEAVAMTGNIYLLDGKKSLALYL